MSTTDLRSRIEPQTMRRWRSLGYWTDEALGWVLESGARSWPDRVAVITPTQSRTYRDLQQQTAAVARTLVRSGVKPGDVVSWMLPTDADALAVASAIWRIGAVSSPIVPTYGVHEMATALDQVRPVAVITDSDFRGRAIAEEFETALDRVGHRPTALLTCAGRVAGWRPAHEAGPGSLPDRIQPASANAPALILFTSGTESAPKAAVHSVAGIGHEVRSCVSEWGVTFRDRMFMASPMTHITGLLQGLLIPLRVGAAAVLMDRWRADEAVDMIERTGTTYMAGATPFLRELLDAYRVAGRDRATIRQYCCGGASVPPEAVRTAGDLGIAAYRAWGMTELPTSSLANELDPIEIRAETDGRLAPGVELRVLDDDGRPIPAGEVGALQLRGPEMMLGYLNAEANQRSFKRGGWLDTGDVGSIDARGCVTVCGRTKDIINRGGEKYSSREIEEALARHPAVRDVAVVAVTGGRLGEQIGAAVVSTRPGLELSELGRHITEAGLSRGKQPERLVLVDEIPRNATGKVDKRAVVELF